MGTESPTARGSSRRGPRRKIHRGTSPGKLYSRAPFPVTGTLTVRYAAANGGTLTDIRDGSLVATVDPDTLPDAACLIEALRTLRQANPALTAAGYSGYVLRVFSTRDGFRLRLTARSDDRNCEFPDPFALPEDDPQHGLRGLPAGDTPEQWRVTVNYLTRLAAAEASPSDPALNAAFAAAAEDWRVAVRS